MDSGCDQTYWIEAVARGAKAEGVATSYYQNT